MGALGNLLNMSKTEEEADVDVKRVDKLLKWTFGYGLESDMKAKDVVEELEEYFRCTETMKDYTEIGMKYSDSRLSFLILWVKGIWDTCEPEDYFEGTVNRLSLTWWVCPHLPIDINYFNKCVIKVIGDVDFLIYLKCCGVSNFQDCYIGDTGIAIGDFESICKKCKKSSVNKFVKYISEKDRVVCD